MFANERFLIEEPSAILRFSLGEVWSISNGIFYLAVVYWLLFESRSYEHFDVDLYYIFAHLLWFDFFKCLAFKF